MLFKELRCVGFRQGVLDHLCPRILKSAPRCHETKGKGHRHKAAESYAWVDSPEMYIPGKRQDQRIPQFVSREEHKEQNVTVRIKVTSS